MSMPSTLLALLLTTSAPAAARCSPRSPIAAGPVEGEAYIRRAETKWASSVAHGDEATFLRRFTADDFAAILEGKVLTRAALIAEAKKRGPGAATDKLEILRVHLFGSVAVAEGSEIWSEAGHQTRIVWSDIWARCGLSWRLVTSTSRGSEVKAPEATPPRRQKATQ